MKLLRVTTADMADILKNFNQLKSDNETRMNAIKMNLEIFRKRAELISQEELILAEAMSSPSMDGGVQGSGYVEDNMLTMLQQSKDLYSKVFQSLIDEQDTLFNQQLMFSVIGQCIMQLPISLQRYITGYYMGGKTVEELVDELQKSRRTVYREVKEALSVLTDTYNHRIMDTTFQAATE